MTDIIDTTLPRVLQLVAELRASWGTKDREPQVDEILAVFGALRGQLERAEVERKRAEGVLDVQRMQMMLKGVEDEHRGQRWTREGVVVQLTIVDDGVRIGPKAMYRALTRRAPSPAVIERGLLLTEDSAADDGLLVTEIRGGNRSFLPYPYPEGRLPTFPLLAFNGRRPPPCWLEDVQDGMDLAVDLKNTSEHPRAVPPLWIVGVLRRPKTEAELGGGAPPPRL